MQQTKVKVALEAEGWKPGDRAFSASVTFGDEDEPCIDDRSVGLFRTRDAAKLAARAEADRLAAAESRDGWWGGEVVEGSIMDQSSRWEGYGYVEDWSFERDERTDAIWFHQGLDWNE